MPRYTRKEFMDMLQIPTHAYLSMAIKRGNVIESGGLIDDSDPTNRDYISKRRHALGIAEPAPQAAAAPSNTPTDQPADLSQPAPGGNTLLNIKTRAQIAKYKEEIDLLKAKKEKIYEEIIPREHAIHLIIALSEGMKGAWMRATETFVTTFAATANLSREDIAEMRKELVGIINEAVQTGVAESKKNLKKIAREYAGKKGKGDRE